MREPETLLGRDAELAILEAFLRDAGRHGSALCLTGDPGIGKTALLDAVARTATGFRLHRADGAPTEADLAGATLYDLLAFDLEPDLTDVPALFSPAVGAPPVLVVVDDLQWSDAGSRTMLSELAAAAPGRRIGVLAGSRDADGLPGVASLRIGPIDDVAAARLVDRLSGPGSPMRERVLAVAGGNPLILTELCRGGWTGGDLPVGRLRDGYEAELSAVPGEERPGLLRAALNDGAEIDLPGARDELAAARRLRIVIDGPSGGSPRFRDPLLRRAVVEAATTAEQARAHRELADAFGNDPQRRAWHLAQASFRPDDKVAELLEEGARRSLKDGRAAHAVTAMLRAAELSTTSTDTGRRLVEAAWIAVTARADLTAVGDLLEAARQADPDLRHPLQAATTAARLLADGSGDADSAHRLLSAAIEAAGSSDRHDLALVEALHQLVDVCRYGRRDELWGRLDDALERLRPGPPPLLTLRAHALRGPVFVTPADLATMDEALHRLDAETDPVRISRVLTAALVLDRGPECRAAALRAIADGRAGGAVRTAMAALFTMGMDGYALGDWDEAVAVGDELVRVAEANGNGYKARLGRMISLVVGANRGEAEEVLRGTREIAAWSAPRGLDSLVQWCHQVQAALGVAEGHFEDAYQHCTVLAPPGTLPYAAFALRSGYDLVESALRTYRTDEAAGYAAALAEARLDRVSDRFALLVAGTAAMVADDVQAPARFAAALALPGAGRYRFEAARLRLLHGERLRRGRRMAQARAQLSVALDEFRRLNATPWTERAVRELEATTSGRRTAPSGHTRLTPQELEVADLAASGLTNKRIAERLQLSPGTVAAHLRQAYHKLGITSRGGLRDALGN